MKFYPGDVNLSCISIFWGEKCHCTVQRCAKQMTSISLTICVSLFPMKEIKHIEAEFYLSKSLSIFVCDFTMLGLFCLRLIQLSEFYSRIFVKLHAEKNIWWTLFKKDSSPMCRKSKLVEPTTNFRQEMFRSLWPFSSILMTHYTYSLRRYVG